MQCSSSSSTTPAEQVNHPVTIALAVIHYEDRYLLGYRKPTQHQGDRYEFIGGKVESGETIAQGLIREVHEEIGLDIAKESVTKLGMLTHAYSDNTVHLHVYSVALTRAQFMRYKEQVTGLEGQSILWVSKAALLSGQYPMPTANAQILEWL